MNIGRRGFLAGIGAAIAAPYVIRTPGLLMPVKQRFLVAPEALADTVMELLDEFAEKMANPPGILRYRDEFIKAYEMTYDTLRGIQKVTTIPGNALVWECGA